MLFNSLVFIVFITVILLVYPRLRLRGQNLFLLVASYVFYGYWNWRFNFLLLLSSVVDFYVGQHLHKAKNNRYKKQLLLTSVTVNLCILGFFKYYNFFIDSMAVVLNNFGFEPHMPVLRVILPVGISFYTFQTMSYTIDIYRGKLAPTTNFIDFALFVSFFPQLVAGPIERARNLLPQITKQREVSYQQVISGLNLILLGYFKKVAIADTLAPIVDKAFTNPEVLSSGELLTGIYAFSIQIYGDFSGYTDIARGVARLLGFELMENFNAPYLSRSITEFWRRWHISLSSWLKEYLYFSLGGNRKGQRRTYINLIITMFLGGLWHGAAWTFVAWGVLHGLYLAIHKFLLGQNKLDLSWPQNLAGWFMDLLKIIFTFHLATFTWILFRAKDFSTAFSYFIGILRFQNITDLSAPVLFAMVLIIILDIVQTWSGTHTWLTDTKSLRPLRYLAVQLLLISVLSAAVFHVNTIIPFIYFQF